jgi:hypothetical protein
VIPVVILAHCADFSTHGVYAKVTQHMNKVPVLVSFIGAAANQ